MKIDQLVFCGDRERIAALADEKYISVMKGTIMPTINQVLLMLIMATAPALGQQSEKPVPPPNWAVLEGTPLKSTTQGNMRIDIFKVDAPRRKAIDYAWATCASLDDSSLVIIWIRGTHEDRRITFTGKNENGLSTVYITKSAFEKYFKYCVLSGIKSTATTKIVASFGGGPAGDREEYWFEWSENVLPAFYCILK